jgi:tetratricopeptide (TPR) repeat protein
MTDESVFAAALDIADPAERAAYLDRACAGNPDLRREVEALLAAHAQPGHFLDRPANATGAYAPDPLAVPGTVVAGRYKLLEEIGEGGMGTVWMAEQREPVKRLVALKLVKPGMDSRAVLARFEAERQALALMDHPHIAKVLDGGTTAEGRPYFVMELVRGIPITQYCDDRQMTVRERLELFVPVCAAVQHAHQKGIIHRDLKPSNVLVTEHDGVPVPKVIDFGLAKALHHQHALTERTLYTAFGTVVGTPLYMAPEQVGLNALDVDTRTDIYALGVILYELLTGTTPLEKKRFTEAAWDEIRRLIREEEPPKPSTRLSTSDALPALAAKRHTEPQKLGKLVRGELDWIVMRALEKDRNRRYSTANAFARDVQRHLADEPVEACPPSAGYRMRKFARKHGAALATVVAFAGLLVLGAAVSTWQAVRATVAERQARAERDAAEQARAEEAAQRRQAEAERERAQAAERQAEQERAVAAAVNDFLRNDLLAQADPGAQASLGHGADKDLKLRTVLDRAAERIEGRFPDQPLMEAAIRQAIGGAYYGLGEYKLAQPHVEAALGIRRQQLGEDHPDTLMSQHSLAACYQVQDLFAQAEFLFLRTLELRRKKLGAGHPDTLRSQGLLAWLSMRQGRYAQAASLLQQALAVQTMGVDHPWTLWLQNNLAAVYMQQGQYAKGELLFLQIWEAFRKTRGADHPDTLMAQNNLAVCYRVQGQYAKAEPLIREAWELRRKQFGADHPQTLTSQAGLALVYVGQGRYAEAEPLLLQALELRKNQGEEHYSTLLCQHELAVLYRSQGQYAKAEPLFLQTLERQTKKLEKDHPATLATQHDLAVLYQAQAQHAKAEALFLDVLERRRRRLGAGHPNAAITLASLGLTLLQQHKYADAEPRLREYVAIFESQRPDAWQTFQLQSLLGGSLLGQKKYAEAEPLLLSGCQGLMQRAATIPAEDQIRLAEALERLVRLYDAWGKPDKAATWRQELEAVKLKQKTKPELPGPRPK